MRENEEAEKLMADRSDLAYFFFTCLIDGKLTGLGAATDAADAPDDAPAMLELPHRRRSIRAGGGGVAPLAPPPRPRPRPPRSPMATTATATKTKSGGERARQRWRAFSSVCGPGDSCPEGLYHALVA